MILTQTAKRDLLAPDPDLDPANVFGGCVEGGTCAPPRVTPPGKPRGAEGS